MDISKEELEKLITTAIMNVYTLIIEAQNEVSNEKLVKHNHEESRKKFAKAFITKNTEMVLYTLLQYDHSMGKLFEEVID